MSSSFPQLLRQSTFAAFDPSISRVYTSTPSSVHKYGDWGLKKPIFRKKGPGYIRVHNLDAGQLLGSDWRSAEQEARFIKAYGDGRTLWTDRDDHFANAPIESSLWAESGLAEPASNKKADLVSDVNNMTEAEFAKYLKKVKAYRNQYLDMKLGDLREETVSKLELPEQRTMVNLGTRGYLSNADITNFQVGLTANQLAKKQTKNIVSQPHNVYGMAYSKMPSSSATVNPLLYHKGRALDHPADDRYGARSGRSALNKNWIVAMGGVAATSNANRGRIANPRSEILREGTDWGRVNRDQGVAMFKITKAQISEPPTVINVERKDARNVRFTPGGTRKPVTPLNTFKFDLQVSPVGDEIPVEVMEYGSKKWVAGKEDSSLESDGDDLMLDSWKDDILGDRTARSGQSSFERFAAKRGDEARSDLSDLIQRALQKMKDRKANEGVRRP
ncbi:hypothetical protein BD324DRAFT_606809 [Kockovaella imperatae]|uniref:Mitochondrial ribosomal protein MRP51 n=1 Tax=Kockovaella imperatae TaxID=4999 RepID=A0A1Y1UUL8_9TREE|nr:hypothetical protein BD324DRAFT_606809 [Kockovaella imperatae]ORX41166.1 hypothetical protein BD324DRAFT_606809 [Kockovaella imperatae]